MSISTAIDPSAVASVVGIKTSFKNLRRENAAFLPQHLAVVGQGNSAASYSTDKVQLTSAAAVGFRFGFGSPLHLAALQLLPENGDGVGTIPVTFFPLVDAVAATAAAGTITPAGTATAAGSFRVLVNNIRSEAVQVSVGDTVADLTAAIETAVNSVLNVPVIAASTALEATLTTKWAGESANGVVLEIEGGDDLGLTFAVVQPTGGATNPAVDPALAQFGNVWYSMVLNCLNFDDTGALDAINTAGVGRWSATVRKPFVSFAGYTGADVATAIAVSDARKADYVNATLSAPASNDYPASVAARQVARIIVRANANPAYDYGGLEATGLTAGDSASQWDYTERDQAVKAGTSTVEVNADVVTLSDVVTFYHPDGELTPAYRYVVDIVKLQTVIFNFDLEFASSKWRGAPLIPDGQATTNRAAKRPKDAVTAANNIISSLGLQAVISNPEAAQERTVAGINESNPKRLDLSVSFDLSGNANIISADLDFGFFFGTAPIIG